MNKSKVYDDQHPLISDKRIHSTQNLPCDLSRLENSDDTNLNRLET